MGVAESVSTSTSCFICLSRSLCLTPKRCSSSTTNRPKSLKKHIFLQQPVRPDNYVNLASLSTAPKSLPAPSLVRKRENCSITVGKALRRWTKVAQCWAARIVVGTRTATCLLSITALNAPAKRLRSCRNPHHRKSAGPSGGGCSMSAFHIKDGPHLVGRFGVGEGFFHFVLPGVVGGEGVTAFGGALAVEGQQFF